MKPFPKKDADELNAIIAKRDLMETLVSRHNQLVAQLPKEIVSDAVATTFQVTKAEIDQNMTALQKVMSELEADCARSKYFRKQDDEFAAKGEEVSLCERSNNE
jgi:hypothetical protein